MNVFLVTSPFQYICAAEARKEYDQEENILLLIKQTREPGASQLAKILKEDDWDHIVYAERNQRAFAIPKAIRQIRKINKSNNINYLFHGEYNAWRTKLLLRNLNVNTEVYYDDGSLTLGEYDRFIKTKKTFYRPRFISDLVIRLQGLKPIGRLPISENLEIFTIFTIEEPTVKVRKNDFKHLRKSYGLDTLTDKTKMDDYALFLGQGSIGVDGTIKSYYIDIIKRFAAKTGKKILYAPHRTEKEDIRKEVLKIENLTYHDSKLPIEIEIAEEGLNISDIGGIASTALYSLKVIYPHINIYSAKQSGEEYLNQISYEDNEMMVELLKPVGIELF